MISPVDAGDVEAFRSAIARSLGLDFDDTKLGFLGELLRQRLALLGRPSAAYLASLDKNPPPAEVHALASALTVGETYFFRHIEQFRAFEGVAVPARVRARAGRRRLSVLSAGCSSGEEPYSIAMILHDALPEHGWEVSIRAVDLNGAALEKARRARYTSWALRETPPEARSRWFKDSGTEVLLEATVRSAVQFEQRNLASDDAELWAEGRYDVVFCRNVIMYFTPEVARNVVKRLERAIAPGGFLFLGHAETLRGLSQQFHLRHTHGTFYYQRSAASGGIEDTWPRGQAEPVPTKDVALAPPGDGWMDAIHQAAERIRALAIPAAEPPSPGWDLPRALELLRTERFAEALDLVRSFPAESARVPDVLLLEAVLLSHQGQLVAAEAACRRLLEVDELSAGAHYVLALCREGSGDTLGAAEHDRVAAYLDPAFAMPRLHLGLLARRSGDRDGARRELGQALLLLRREDPSRILLFGGGFGREALIALCSAELEAAGRP